MIASLNNNLHEITLLKRSHEVILRVYVSHDTIVLDAFLFFEADQK